jgi:hypothetical protein
MSALGYLSDQNYLSLTEKHPLLNFKHEHCRDLFLEKIREAKGTGQLVLPTVADPQDDNLLSVIKASEDLVFDSYPIGRYLHAAFIS